MHLDEGRPLVIVISGIIVSNSDKDDVFSLNLKLFKDIVSTLSKKGKEIFSDGSGVLFEFEKKLVSIASKAYLSLSCNRDGLPFIFTIFDLMYPFYGADAVHGEIKSSEEFVKKLLKDVMPDEFKKFYEINLVDIGFLNTPLSLNKINLLI